MNAYLIDGVRTPIGNLRGSLASVRPDDLAAYVLKALISKQKSLTPTDVDDVILGCSGQAGEDNRNVARMALLLAGFPPTVPGETINRLCASGLSAAINASRALKLGEARVMIAGGVESMTRAPMVMSKSATSFGGDQEIYDSSFGWRFVNPRMQELYGAEAMGETAENLVERDKITREEQDRFALASQMKAARAQQAGRFAMEIVTLEIPQKKGEPLRVEKDEFIKPQTSLEGLTKLKPAFRKNGSVTAGNSSGLNDGAAAILMANDEGVKKFGLKPLARILSSAVVGVEPRIMGIGPVPATKLALERANLKLSDIDVIELNEAFAAQSIAVLRGLGLRDDDPRVNPHGGAIALGHPLGMSGARILLSAARELALTEKRYALVTMCIGVGQGYAVIIERVKE